MPRPCAPPPPPQLDPRDLEQHYEGREHMNKFLKEAENKYVVSLGDLGESKDCTQARR